MAKQLLQQHGYYNVINGYREPFMLLSEDNIKKYKDGIHFDQIYDLYIFDLKIRDAIIMSMIDFEDHLKAVLSDIIGSAFGADSKQYLLRNNYRDKKVSNPRFNRNDILHALEKTVKFSQKDPVKHYRNNHGIVPPWILFKDTYLSTIVNLVRFLKQRERDILINRLFKGPITEENLEDYKSLMSDLLFMVLDYRNQTAHGSRIYSYIPKSTLRPFFDDMPSPGLPQLVFALEQLKYNVSCSQIKTVISEAVNTYCKAHGTNDDIHIIEYVTGFSITHNHYVWINSSTKKYHLDTHCSGSYDLHRMLFEQAVEENYTPCKRCFVPEVKNN